MFLGPRQVHACSRLVSAAGSRDAKASSRDRTPGGIRSVFGSLSFWNWYSAIMGRKALLGIFLFSAIAGNCFLEVNESGVRRIISKPADATTAPVARKKINRFVILKEI